MRPPSTPTTWRPSSASTVASRCSCPSTRPALVGRDAVRAGYQAVFATIKLDIRFELHDLTQAGDWAWARTSSAGRTHILAADLEVTEGNNELFVFRREDGAWRIHRYLFATNQPRS
jgi:ketosteroid isomerase-like protein